VGVEQNRAATKPCHDAAWREPGKITAWRKPSKTAAWRKPSKITAWREPSMTILLVTHEPREAQTLARRSLTLHHGQLVQPEGTPP
jgi:hypothetical protein